jgi:hypothetical protein
VINPATKAVSNEMVATPSRWLQLFDPPADAVYTIEFAAQLTGVPRRTILVYCKHRLLSPLLDTGLEAIPLMATGFVHCVTSKRFAQSAATILPASESFST